jgi:ATP-dependent DNA helicase RecG
MRPSEIIPWFAGVESLKYIGPASRDALKRLLRVTREVEEVATRPPVIRDLLFHLPRGLIDRRTLTPIRDLKKGVYAVIEATITEHRPPPARASRKPYQVATNDDSGLLVLTFFHVKGDYLTRQLPIGSRQLIAGMVEMYHGYPTMAHPEVIAPVSKAVEVLRLVPEYPLTAGLSGKVLHKAVLQALASLKPLPEWLDAAMLKAREWPAMLEALQQLHAPDQPGDAEVLAPPRCRLAYDEMLANQLALAIVRRSTQRQMARPIIWDVAWQHRLEAALPFTLTAGQQEVLQQIAQDMQSGHRMVRLLQGDVGSGKTILAFAAMLQAVVSGHQACLMAPTDLLARQHLASLTPLAEALGIRLGFLSGKMKKADQAAVLAQVAAGEIAILIGTHALFQEAVVFRSLMLMVVDEQHRFGVAQRMRLAAKGDQPHLLQMSATPIPRSLGMTLYGDMEISSLTERPPGRKPIDTRAVPHSRAADVIEGLARVIHAGEKAYWVCPLIEAQTEEEKAALNLDLAAAEERFAELSRHFPGKVGLMHGRMKIAEREQVMHAFAHGALQLLVATTVVEVGVNVPQATVMVVEHAERFGLAQLHQLRGRVGRSEAVSRCILLYYDPLSELAKSRLRILRETNDGFVIAEEDLRLRGAGDMLGTRQTGMPAFVMADLAHHLPLLKMANDDAKLVLHRDPDLSSDRGRALRLLLALYEYDAAMAQLKAV